MASEKKGISYESLRASLWFWPMTAALVSLAVALALLPVRPAGAVASWAWPGDAQGAATMVQLVGTAAMSAATLTFSVTVVALQLASQQFSPRLLREFARDPVTQTALAILVSTFVVSMATIRGIRQDEALPVAAIALVQLLGVVSAGALLGFVGHLVRALRVDTMMVAVHEEAAATIVQTYPEYGDTEKVPPADLESRTDGLAIRASRSGFVRVIRPGALVKIAAELGVVVRLDVRPGDHVTAGAPLGIAWGDGASPEAVALLARRTGEVIDIGVERTSEQDVAFGLRQLTDIAVKAISPGINDPVTAATALGHAADLLVRLQGRRLGTQAHTDERGVVRALTPDRDHRYYLDLVCAPVRRFGRHEPVVLSAVLRLLRDCAFAVRDEAQRHEIARQRDLVLAEIADDVHEDDRRSVVELGDRVQLALDGAVEHAYRDRAGETRSF